MTRACESGLAARQAAPVCHTIITAYIVYHGAQLSEAARSPQIRHCTIRVLSPALITQTSARLQKGANFAGERKASVVVKDA